MERSEKAPERTPEGPRTQQAAPSGATAPGAPADGRDDAREQDGGRGHHAAEWSRRKYSGSWAQTLWHRLDAADFMNRAMVLAATLLLCVVPFFLIVTALAGGSATADLSRRFGLSHQAAADLGALITSSSETSSAVSGLSWVFFVLSGVAGATAVQQLYQRVFDQPSRGPRDALRALVWLGLVVGLMFLVAASGPGVHRTSSVLYWLVGYLAATCFFWFSMWFLLAGRLPWRRLLPCAVATGACWTGMIAVFSAVLSGMIVSYDHKYGAIGVVFALMSVFIAVGVVLILGAALGLVWTDHGLSFRDALTKLRRKP